MRHHFSVRIGPVGFRIGSAWPGPIQTLRTLYADYPAPADGIADFTVRLEPGRPWRRFIRPAVEIRGDFTLPDAAPLPLAQGLLAAEMGMNLQMALGQRRYLLLHASAVERDGRALLMTGNSGAGKSTLAATLARRGHVLLADDVTALDGPTLWPALPRLKLWPDSLAAFGIERAGLARTRSAQDKFNLAPRRFDPAPVRLSAVYGLVTARGAMRVGIEAIAGRAAVAMLAANVYRPSLGPLLGRQAAIFTAVVQIAQRAAIHTLIRPDDLAALDDVARQVEGHVAALAS